MDGIDGLKGVAPVGAVLSVGRKQGAGFPIENDRFHMVSVKEINGVRPHHSQFATFNESKPEQRRMIRGALVHGTRRECFEYSLRNQVGPNGAHPNRRPFCVGDGERAVRWMGGEADNFKNIECPNEQCEFRQRVEGKPIPCRPFMRFLFHIAWAPETQQALRDAKRTPMPEMLVRYQSASWNTTRNFVGFFDHIDTAARGLGLDEYSLFGLPFVMTLTRQTKPSEKTSFPVVSITPTMEPAVFFTNQRRMLRELASDVPRIALTDASQRQEADADYAAITVPTD